MNTIILGAIMIEVVSGYSTSESTSSRETHS